MDCVYMSIMHRISACNL